MLAQIDMRSLESKMHPAERSKNKFPHFRTRSDFKVHSAFTKRSV